MNAGGAGPRFPDGVGVGALVPYEADAALQSTPPSGRHHTARGSPSPMQLAQIRPPLQSDPLLDAERARVSLEVRLQLVWKEYLSKLYQF